jgi:signal transduction histidine kinase
MTTGTDQTGDGAPSATSDGGRAQPAKRRPRWGALSTQFLVAGGLLMQIAMILAGALVSQLVEAGAIRSKAASTALLMQSVLGPLLQDLAGADRLSEAAIARLDRAMADEATRRRFPHFEVWTPGGVVVYSNEAELIGRAFPPPPGLSRALKGDVASDYTDLDAHEHTIRGIGIRFLEIYAPIRATASNRIIAVAEIHEDAEPFRQELSSLRMKSWGIVALATLVILLGLFGIVRRASRTIELQSEALTSRIAEVEAYARQNEILRERAQRASARVAELNERFMRGIGADLHDGPAQMISYAVLKTDELRSARNRAEREAALKLLDAALSEAVRDIRSISRGLLLPEIAALPLHEVIGRAVQAHEDRTGTPVAFHAADIVEPVSQAVKICVFRFVQEGLNNAWRHGGGRGQQVASALADGVLVIAVLDHGPASAGGDKALADKAGDRGLGLHGLSDRLESLGGSLSVVTAGPAGGTRVEMRLPLAAGLLAETPQASAP